MDQPSGIASGLYPNTPEPGGHQTNSKSSSSSLTAAALAPDGEDAATAEDSAPTNSVHGSVPVRISRALACAGLVGESSSGWSESRGGGVKVCRGGSGGRQVRIFARCTCKYSWQVLAVLWSQLSSRLQSQPSNPPRVHKLTSSFLDSCRAR